MREVRGQNSSGPGSRCRGLMRWPGDGATAGSELGAWAKDPLLARGWTDSAVGSWVVGSFGLVLLGWFEPCGRGRASGVAEVHPYSDLM